MSELQGTLLVMLALVALGVVRIADPLRQVLLLGVYGLLLALLFFVLGAPDVALSQIVVSSVGLPVMVLLALAKVRGHAQEDEDGDGDEKP